MIEEVRISTNVGLYYRVFGISCDDVVHLESIKGKAHGIVFLLLFSQHSH